VIKQSGGAIAVESVAGRGTTFHVYLPRVDSKNLPEAGQTPEEGSTHASAGDAGRGSGRILVVEDETAVRRLVERLLTAKGYTVVSAGDGREALEILSSSDVPLDLLITDLVLPGGLDGAAIAEAARTAVPGLPVLFMSGYSREAHVGTRSGLHDLPYLKKPFAPDELYAEVRGALGRE
jgi:CheY-like chemotaxis protein